MRLRQAGCPRSCIGPCLLSRAVHGNQLCLVHKDPGPQPGRRLREAALMRRDCTVGGALSACVAAQMGCHEHKQQARLTGWRLQLDAIPAILGWLTVNFTSGAA